MNYHPILFTGPMVRAILDGRKTQTRRVVKPQPESIVVRDIGEGCTEVVWKDAKSLENAGGGGDVLQYMVNKRCPYGVPGDRLWVREACRIWAPTGEDGNQFFGWAVRYREDNTSRITATGWDEGPDQQSPEDCGIHVEPTKWRPSIHMPRWASRITLEVKAVCVERVQEITVDAAHAEGIEGDSWNPAWQLSFRKLWDSINAKRGYGWDANPWVWVVEFSREAEKEQS